MLLQDEGSGFRTVCSAITMHKERLRELEGEVFESLPREGRIESYQHSTHKIMEIVNLKNEVYTLCNEMSSTNM